MFRRSRASHGKTKHINTMINLTRLHMISWSFMLQYSYAPFESIWYRLAAWGQGCEWIQVAPCASRSKSDRRPSRIKPSFQGVQSKKRLLQGILCLEPRTGMRHAKTNVYSHFEKENFKSRFGTSCIHTTDRLEPCAMLSGLAPVPKHFLRKRFERNTRCLRLI